MCGQFSHAYSDQAYNFLFRVSQSLISIWWWLNNLQIIWLSKQRCAHLDCKISLCKRHLLIQEWTADDTRLLTIEWIEVWRLINCIFPDHKKKHSNILELECHMGGDGNFYHFLLHQGQKQRARFYLSQIPYKNRTWNVVAKPGSTCHTQGM